MGRGTANASMFCAHVRCACVLSIFVASLHAVLFICMCMCMSAHLHEGRIVRRNGRQQQRNARCSCHATPGPCPATPGPAPRGPTTRSRRHVPHRGPRPARARPHVPGALKHVHSCRGASISPVALGGRRGTLTLVVAALRQQRKPLFARCLPELGLRMSKAVGDAKKRVPHRLAATAVHLPDCSARDAHNTCGMCMWHVACACVACGMCMCMDMCTDTQANAQPSALLPLSS